MLIVPPARSLDASKAALKIVSQNPNLTSLYLRATPDKTPAATAIIYCEGNFGDIDGKTANGLISRSEKYQILSVIDSEKAGLDTGMVLDNNPNTIPICRDLADSLAQAGIQRLGDSRIKNIEAMHLGPVPAAITLIRSPMPSQAKQVVRHANISCNTGIEVIRQLSLEAQKAGRNHGMMLMVKLGDLSEGIMPNELMGNVRAVFQLPSLVSR